MSTALSKSTIKSKHDKERDDSSSKHRAQVYDGSLMKRKLTIGVPAGSALHDEAKRLYGFPAKTTIGSQKVIILPLTGDDGAGDVDGVLADVQSNAKGFDWGSLAKTIGKTVITNLPTIASTIGGIISNAQGKGLDSQPFVAAIDEDVNFKKDLRNQSDQFDGTAKPRFYSLRDINTQQVKPDVVVVSKQFAQSNPVFAPTVQMPGFTEHLADLVKSINSKCLACPNLLQGTRALRIAIPTHDPLWNDVTPFAGQVLGHKALERRFKTMFQGHKIEYVFENEPHDVVMTSDANFKAANENGNVVVAKEGAVEATLGLLTGTKEQQNGKNFDWIGLASTAAQIALGFL